MPKVISSAIEIVKIILAFKNLEKNFFKNLEIILFEKSNKI